MAASLRSGLGFVGVSLPPPRATTSSRTEPPRPAVAGLYAAATAAIASRRIIEDVARALQEPLNKQPRVTRSVRPDEWTNRSEESLDESSTLLYAFS